jgi:putative transposase
MGQGLVERAERWPYSSLRARLHAEDPTREILADWLIERPINGIERVNTPLSVGELKRLRSSVARGRTFGDDGWVERAARRLGLEHTLRPEGRPPQAKLTAPRFSSQAKRTASPFLVEFF